MSRPREPEMDTMDLLRVTDDAIAGAMAAYRAITARAGSPGSRPHERRMAHAAEHAVWALVDLSSALLVVAREEGLIHLGQPGKRRIPTLSLIPGGKTDPPERRPSTFQRHQETHGAGSSVSTAKLDLIVEPDPLVAGARPGAWDRIRSLDPSSA